MAARLSEHIEMAVGRVSETPANDAGIRSGGSIFSDITQLIANVMRLQNALKAAYKIIDRKNAEIVLLRQNIAEKEQVIAQKNAQISQKDEQISQKEKAAVTDKLTGAFNRGYLEKIHQDNDRRVEKGDYVLYIDLNKFKFINDTYGHAAGDKVLCKTVEMLKSRVRESDSVVRMGGDEFLIHLKSSGVDAADKICVEIVKGFQVVSKETDLPVSGSVGIYKVPQNDMSMEQILEQADVAMYAEKQKSRLNAQVRVPTI